MSRRRYISTKISLDTKVNKLALTASDFAGLFYTWMIPHAEDNGQLPGDPEELLMMVTPGRRDKTPEDVAAALEAMVTLGLIEWSRAPGNEYVAFPAAAFYAYQTYIPPAKRAGSVPENPDDEQPLAQISANQRKSAQIAASPSLSPSLSLSLTPTPSSPSERENDRRDDDGADAPAAVGIVDVTDSSLCSEVAKAARIGIDAKELRNLLERHKHLGRQRLIFEAELAAAWIADPQRNKGKNPRKMSVLFLNNWYAKATQPLPQEEANRGRSAAHTGHSGHTGHSSSSARPTGTYRTREIARDPAIWEQRAAILDERRRLAGFPN